MEPKPQPPLSDQFRRQAERSFRQLAIGLVAGALVGLFIALLSGLVVGTLWGIIFGVVIGALVFLGVFPGSASKGWYELLAKNAAATKSNPDQK